MLNLTTKKKKVKQKANASVEQKQDFMVLFIAVNIVKLWFFT